MQKNEIIIEELEKQSKDASNIAVIDARVYSTEAGNRGMGRYLNSVIKYFYQAGFSISLILYKKFSVESIDKELSKYLYSLKYIDLDPASFNQEDIHKNSYEIEKILKELNAKVYVDSTPFLSPSRFDVNYCPVIAIAYDLIPLRYYRDYLYYPEHFSVYRSGLERLRKADAIIAISDYTKQHIVKYLGISASKIEIIYPNISNEYYENESSTNIDKKDIFSIVGGHKSKNPENSLRLLSNISQINTSLLNRVNVCVPTLSQLKDVTSKYNTNNNNNNLFNFLSNIPESSKIKYQKEARVVAHLSIEEGFGIPLLEALFLNTNVIVLDTLLNREILNNSGDAEGIAVFLRPNSVEIDDVDKKKIENLLLIKNNQKLFKKLKDYFKNHWDNSFNTINILYKTASDNFNIWNKDLNFSLVSNTPYNFCGVADYCSSFGYVKSNNYIIYTKDNYVKKVNAFTNVKLKSYLSFPEDQMSLNHPVIFNLAFSDSLSFGVDFIRLYAKSKDKVIFHDMAYLFGLYYYYNSINKLDIFYNEYFVNEDKPIADIVKVIVAGDQELLFERFLKIEKIYSSAWLRMKGCNLICQTPLVKNENFEGFNCLLRNALTFIPMGIDDRHKVIDSNLCLVWRQDRKINPEDIIITVIGSVTSNKFLVEVSKVLTQLIPTYETNSKKIYFLICGKIIDSVVYNNIVNNFVNAGLSNRVLQISPNEEVTLDHIIVASNAIVCLRKQDRIQLSHSFVRSLSLGKPIISTNFTGFYDIKEFSSLLSDTILDSIERFLILNYKNTNKLSVLSKESRLIYSKNHDINNTLYKILNS